MTFEATDNRASTAGAEETTAPFRRVRRASAPRPLASQLLDFVSEASSIGGRLQGLALLFRSTFLPDCGDPPDNWDEAARIVAEMMDTMAKSLADIDVQAHQVHNHEKRGGAR